MSRSVRVPQTPNLSGIQPTPANTGLQQIQDVAQAANMLGGQLQKVGAKIRNDREHLSASQNLLVLKEFRLHIKTKGYGATRGSAALPQKDGPNPRKEAIALWNARRAELEKNMTPGAINMMRSAADSVSLGLQEFALTHELKEQRASEQANRIADASQHLKDLEMMAVEPEIDPVAREAMEAQDAISPTGQDPKSGEGTVSGESAPAIRQKKRDARLQAGLEAEDSRSQLQVGIDGLASIARDAAIAGGAEPGSEEVKVAERNARSQGHSTVINSRLSQGDADGAKSYLDSVPASEFATGVKGRLAASVRAARSKQRAEKDKDKALDLTFKVLDQATSELSQLSYQSGDGGVELYVTNPSVDQVIDRALDTIESKWKNKEITTSVYDAARSRITSESNDLIKSQNAEATELAYRVLEEAPNATSLEELPNDLVEAARRNPVFMSMLKGRAGASTAKGLVGLFAGNAQRLSESQAAAQTIQRERDYVLFTRDAKSLNSLVERKHVKAKGEDAEAPSTQMAEQYIVAHFYPLGDERMKAALNAYRSMISGSTPSDPGWKSMIKSAALSVMGPTKDVSFFGARKRTDAGVFVRTAAISDRGLEAVDSRLRKAWKDGKLGDRPTMDRCIEYLQEDFESTRFFFDYENEDVPDQPVPVWLVKAYQKTDDLEGRMVVNIGIGSEERALPVGSFGQAFLARAKQMAPAAIKKVAEEGGFSEEVAAYKLIQDQIDRRDSNTLTTYERRGYKTKQDFDTLMSDARMSERILSAAEDIVAFEDVSQIDAVVVQSLKAAKDQIGVKGSIDATQVDQARKYIREHEGQLKGIDLKTALGQLEVYANYVSFNGSARSTERREEYSMFVADRLKQLEEQLGSDETKALRQEIEKLAARPDQIIQDAQKREREREVRDRHKLSQVVRAERLADRRRTQEMLTDISTQIFEKSESLREMEDGVKTLNDELRNVYREMFGARQKQVRAVGFGPGEGAARAAMALRGRDVTGQKSIPSFKDWLKSLEGN